MDSHSGRFKLSTIYTFLTLLNFSLDKRAKAGDGTESWRL